MIKELNIHKSLARMITQAPWSGHYLKKILTNMKILEDYSKCLLGDPCSVLFFKQSLSKLNYPENICITYTIEAMTYNICLAET